MEAEKKIYTLNQLTTSFENFISKHFWEKTLWVSAEIAKVQRKGGHLYFELVETREQLLQCQIQANFWSRNYEASKDKNGGTIDEILSAGNKALFLVRIEYHKIFGLKLNILDVDPSYSFGEMERQKQLTIERLKKEGLYLRQKSKYLPRICKRIALIGSPETSGFQDFTKTLLQNEHFSNFVIKVFAATVQGEKAAKEIAQKIEQAQHYDVDVIVLVRGGGSKTDLHVFNHYDLCKAIAMSDLPVVTGIGHETDDVIAAHVSRMDCITPTAAAKHFYIQIKGFLSELQQYFDAAIQKSLVYVQAQQLEFFDLQKRLNYWSKSICDQNSKELREIAQELFHIANFFIVNQFQDIDLLQIKVENAAKQTVQAHRDIRLANFTERIQSLSVFQLERERLKVDRLAELLSIVNPLSLLEKGYTISTIENVDINDLNEIPVGAELKTLSMNKLITSKITQIKSQQYGQNES